LARTGSGGRIAAGVLFGGALTSALGWRAVFFLNVPIGVAVVGGTLRTVTRGDRRQAALRRRPQVRCHRRRRDE